MRTTSVRKFTRALMMSMALATIAFSGNAISAEMTTKHKAIKECSVCHTQENAVAGNAFVVPSDKTCIGCHGDYKALAAKTQPKDPHDPNPHASTIMAPICPARLAMLSIKKAVCSATIAITSRLARSVNCWARPLEKS